MKSLVRLLSRRRTTRPTSVEDYSVRGTRVSFDPTALLVREDTSHMHYDTPIFGHLIFVKNGIYRVAAEYSDGDQVWFVDIRVNEPTLRVLDVDTWNARHGAPR